MVIQSKTYFIETFEMDTKFINTIRLSENDNVVVAKCELEKGIKVDRSQVTTTEHISSGHKIATELIQKGSVIRKYNQVIGNALNDIHPGNHVHTHNCGMVSLNHNYLFSDELKPSNVLPNSKQANFMGIVREDGKVATRNYIGVLTSVNCSATVARHIAAKFNDQILSEYPNVDGVISLTHDYGCGGCAGIGINYIQRTISGYARHPNFHSVLILGLGCEANQIGAMMDVEK